MRSDGIAFDDIAVFSLPTWLNAAADAVNWDPQTKSLVVTGPATIVADPGADAPAITVSGASATPTINPTAGAVVNVGALALTGGGRAT